MIPRSRAFLGAACVLALAACAPETPQQDAAAKAGAEQAAPALPDPGRGGMLNQRADQAERAIRAIEARGLLPQAETQAMLAEVEAARDELSERLAASAGPLPQADREAVSTRLAAVESRLTGLSAISAP